MLSIQSLIAGIGWVALALGTGLLGGERQRRLGAAGLLVAGLGVAALRAGRTEPGIPPADSDQGFLMVNGGLLLLGLGLAAWAAWSAAPGPTRLAGRLATGVGFALVGWLVAEPVIAAGVWRTVVAAVGSGLIGAGVIAAARALGAAAPARTVGRLLFAPPLRPSIPDRPGLISAVLLASAAAVAVGPHVAIICLGVVAASWAGYFGWRPSRRLVPIAPILTLALLPAYWLLATVAGPIGLERNHFLLVPLSPAAESIVAALLLLVAWSLAGLWPLQRQLPGAITGVVGAILIVWFMLPLAYSGMEQWRPLMVPLLVVGIWHAAARGRWPLVASGAGLLGVVSPDWVGVFGAGWLLATALALEIYLMRSDARAIAWPVRAATWVAAAWGGLLTLEGALQGEVVYSAVGTLGLALLISGRATPREAI